MGMNYFTFDGLMSKDLGVYCSGNHVYNSSEREYDSVVVPGRNGDLLIGTGRWNGVDITYPCFAYGTEATWPTIARNIRNWLGLPKGYRMLRDTYNPDEFRYAYFKGPLDISSAQLKVGSFNVTFRCTPERWLDSGEVITQVKMGEEPFFSNPTGFDTHPLIYVKWGNADIGKGLKISSNLYNGNTTSFEVINLPQVNMSPIIIDTADCTAYDAKGNNRSSLINGNLYEFIFSSLDNTVLIEGLEGYTSSTLYIELKPRWWSL